MAEGEPTGAVLDPTSPDVGAPRVPDSGPPIPPKLTDAERAKLQKEWDELGQQLRDVEKAGGDVTKAREDIRTVMREFLAKAPPEFRDEVKPVDIPEASEAEHQLVRDLIHELHDRDYLAERIAAFRTEGKRAQAAALEQLNALINAGVTEEHGRITGIDVAKIETRFHQEQETTETRSRRKAWGKIITGVLGAVGSTGLALSGWGSALSTIGFGASFSELTQGLIELRALKSSENVEAVRLEGQLQAWKNYAKALELAQQIKVEDEKPEHMAALLRHVATTDKESFEQSARWRKAATKLAHQKAWLGLLAGISTTVGGALFAKHAFLEHLMREGVTFNWDQGAAHVVQKTKDGFVFLYNSAAEPMEMARRLGRAAPTVIKGIGEHGAHVLGQAGGWVQQAFERSTEMLDFERAKAFFSSIGMLANGLNLLSLRGLGGRARRVRSQDELKSYTAAAESFDAVELAHERDRLVEESREAAKKAGEAEQPSAKARKGDLYTVAFHGIGGVRGEVSQIDDGDDTIILRLTDPEQVRWLRTQKGPDGKPLLGPRDTALHLTRDQFNDPTLVRPLDEKFRHYTEEELEILTAKANELTELKKDSMVTHLKFISSGAASRVRGVNGGQLYEHVTYRVATVDEERNRITLYDAARGRRDSAVTLVLTDLLDAVEFTTGEVAFQTEAFPMAPPSAGSEEEPDGVDDAADRTADDSAEHEPSDSSKVGPNSFEVAEGGRDSADRIGEVRLVHELRENLTETERLLTEQIEMFEGEIDPAQAEQLKRYEQELTQTIKALDEFERAADQPEEPLLLSLGDLRDRAVAIAQRPITGPADCVSADLLVTKEERRVGFELQSDDGFPIDRVSYQLDDDSFLLWGWPTFESRLIVPRNLLEALRVKEGYGDDATERLLTDDEQIRVGALREQLERGFWVSDAVVLERRAITPEGFNIDVNFKQFDFLPAGGEAVHLPPRADIIYDIQQTNDVTQWRPLAVNLNSHEITVHGSTLPLDEDQSAEAIHAGRQIDPEYVNQPRQHRRDRLVVVSRLNQAQAEAEAEA